MDAIYPAVLRVPHYQVMRGTEYTLEPQSHRLHHDRSQAECERRECNSLYRTLVEDGSMLFTIMEVGTVYLPRCGECADLPDGDPTAYEDWWDLRAALAGHLGWMATSDMHVFCPRHRPSGEE